MATKFIIGIDEVGRGAVAGPLYMCAFALPVNKLSLKGVSLPPLRDSKKLSHAQRAKWLSYFLKARKDGKITWTIASVSPKTIDRIGMAEAVRRATTRAASGVVKKVGRNVKILLDGGLYANKKHPMLRGLAQETLIRGDERIPAISCASIVAKEKRDALMRRMHNIDYPDYGFNEHKGYGTEAHRRAVLCHGPSDIHRLTFIRTWVKIGKK